MVELLYNEVSALILTGHLSHLIEDEDLAIEKTILLLSKAAKETPEFLLKTILDVVKIKKDGMALLALAALTGHSSLIFINDKKNIQNILSILHIYEPSRLLEYVEFLKSKKFGRGFGSRPQKWVRSIMEGWSIDILDLYVTNQITAFYALLRLVHPRYHGTRGEKIKECLVNTKH